MKKLNTKKLLSYVLLGVLLVFILVLTWIPIVFDIGNLNFNKWFTNTLISIGIMIAAIILGEIFGEDKQKEKVVYKLDQDGNPTEVIIGGLYQKALYEFNKKLRELVDTQIHIYFHQFYIWFKARELKQKKESYLVDNGFDQMAAHLIVRFIEKDDLEKMKAGVFTKVDEKTGKEIKFKKIHEDEYLVLLEIFSTDFQIDAPKYTYYLSAFGHSTSESILEQSTELEKREKINKTFHRVFKILLSVFISALLGMAAIQELTEGGVKEAAVNTISRMISLVGGLLSGYMTSIVAVKLAAQKLENKTQVLSFMTSYMEKGEFKPKTYEELVKEEEEQEKQIEGESAPVVEETAPVTEEVPPVDKNEEPVIETKEENDNG